MRYILLSLSAAALLAACGKDSAPSDAASDAADATEEFLAEAEGPGRDLSAVDVCALVPAEAIATATGGTVDGNVSATEPGFDGKGCRYEVRIAGLRKSPEISLHPPATCDLWRDIQSFPLEDISGIGDRAFWGKRTDQVDLYVKKSGDVCLHVQAHGQDLPQAQAIAEAVLGRL